MRGHLIFCLVLALPAGVMLIRLAQGEWIGDLLHGSGEMSARLMIVAMMLTPLRMLFPTARWLLWLRRHRRTLGVAAFAYAVLHTVFYVVDMQTLEAMLKEIGVLGIWTGWVAMLIFVPLALTSNDRSTRWLGPRWQTLHRLTYVAAVLTLLHWATIHNNVMAAWIHFTPLILLETYRVYHIFKERRLKAA